MTNTISNIPSASQLLNNILAFYRKCTPQNMVDGLNWYKEAHYFAQTLSEVYGVSFAQVVAVIAVLSPSNSWEGNKVNAEAIINAFNKDRTGRFCYAVKVSTYNANKEKAIEALINPNTALPIVFNTQRQSNRKVSNFASNILNPYSDAFVTIDRHAARIAYGVTGSTVVKSITPNRYEAVKKAYQQAANSIDSNLLPCELQAVTWLRYRELYVK